LAETHYHPQVSAYLKLVSGSKSWSEADRTHALDLAQKAAVPSRLEEDWRKTDPDAFPWSRIEEVDPERSQTIVTMRGLDGGETKGITALVSEGEEGERIRKMLMIAGDD